VSAARPALAIVGAGGLASAFAAALSRSGGVRITIASRRPASASALARRGRRLHTALRIEDAVAHADIILLAVPDRVIASLARSLVPMRESWRGVVVLHAAGAYGPEFLTPLRARGAATGVLHPLAVLGPRGETGLDGAAARIEGSKKAQSAARRLCELVGLVPLRSSKRPTAESRSSYHAAASLASNDLVALLAAAQALLVRHGVDERAALRALTTLAEGALASVRRTGPLRALTGPVARNDGTTLSAQLRTLADDDPHAGEAHRALSMRLVDLAEAGGRLDEMAARGLRRLLARGPGRRTTV
jgi:predicted short-subunit dehydrogenase-like oxidoreductase (DUF2520 family)